MAEYYTTDEVAKFCNVSRSSVIRWIRDGDLKAAVTMGGHNRILKEDLLKLLETLNLPLPATEQAIHKPVALIVDDEESMRRIITVFLNRAFPQFQVEEASDGFEAGMKIQKLKPELILLDLRLPGQDGIVVCKQIRDNPEFAKCIIIVVTGVQDAIVKESVLFFGANDYLTKPFEFDQLREKIEFQLAAQQSGKDADRGPSKAA